MSNELLTFMEYVERERGLKREVIVEVLENAILSAASKGFNAPKEIKVNINPESGKLTVTAVCEVISDDAEEDPDHILLAKANKVFPDAKVGDKVDWEFPPSTLGRLVANAAKQNIKQLLTRAERLNAERIFSDQVGSIIFGTVKDFVGKDIIINFQQADGVMKEADSIREENYEPGDKISVLLKAIDKEGRGPSLLVSRRSPDFVRRLFEREVSEIHDGIVEIKGIARDAGHRTKIAVASSDERVDPVGACVGVRGSRVRRITDELGNERIDIVPYDEDIAKFTANALLPGKINSVIIDEERHELRVAVSEDQSKIVFGRKAQNVRLAGRLLGWNIKICDEKMSVQTSPDIDEKIKQAAEQLAGDTGLKFEDALKLVNSGFVTPDGLMAADEATVMAVPGIDHEALQTVIAQLKSARNK